MRKRERERACHGGRHSSHEIQRGNVMREEAKERKERASISLSLSLSREKG
jgi:hypothetical protein